MIEQFNHLKSNIWSSLRTLLIFPIWVVNLSTQPVDLKDRRLLCCSFSKREQEWSGELMACLGILVFMNRDYLSHTVYSNYFFVLFNVHCCEML